MARSHIGIIIPVKNEEKTIKKIVVSVLKYGDVVIVNDCSTDNSLKNIKDFKIKIINNKISLGYEKTIITGIKYCLKKKYRFIATIDGDAQHDPKFFKNISKIKKFDLLIAKRDKYNRFSEYLFAYFCKNTLKIDDPLSGMKVYNYDTLKKIRKIKSHNTLNTFLLFQLNKHCKKIYQISSKIRKRNDISRLGNFLVGELKVFKSLLKLMLLIFLMKIFKLAI